MRALALTIGEPAGIGCDIALAAWTMRREHNLPAFYLIADPHHVAARAQQIGVSVPLRPSPRNRPPLVSTPPCPSLRFKNAPPLLPAVLTIPAPMFRWPRYGARYGTCDGRASAIVTNPIAKAVLYRAGFPDPGHTEYLARLAHDMMGVVATPVMMLWCEELAVVPVTIHVPLRAVPDLLTADLIVETGRIVAHDLTHRFGIRAPRLAIAGLNPHAGEDGMIGDEEVRIIRPAIERLAALGIDVARPAAGRHAVPRGRAPRLRRRVVHVSRSGAGRDQDAGLR